jgi:uncharacterized protein (DUF2225 family)
MEGNTMIIVKTIHTEKKITQANPENHSQYLKYERLLDQYLENKNDEEKRREKFNEITTQYQKLVQMGILGS